MEIEIKTQESTLDVNTEKAGPQGFSAYEVAVKNGYVGTEQEWLASLKGDKGDKGDTGEQGIQGERGLQGEQGIQGIQGEKGEKGDKGEQGEKGQDGANGTNGRDGYVQYTAGDNITIENNVISADVPVVDLSNYYTKNETNLIVDKKIPIYTFTMDDNFYNDTTSPHVLSNSERTRLAEIINDAYSKGYSIINILVNYKKGSSTSEYLCQALCFNMYDYAKDILGKPSYLNFMSSPSSMSFAVPYTSSNNYQFIMVGLQIYLTWQNDICSVNSNSYFQGMAINLATSYALTNYLAKNNSASYTPTNNYHPATKKYVDDEIANAVGDINTVLATLTNPQGGN